MTGYLQTHFEALNVTEPFSVNNSESIVKILRLIILVPAGRLVYILKICFLHYPLMNSCRALSPVLLAIMMKLCLLTIAVHLWKGFSKCCRFICGSFLEWNGNV